MTTGLAVKVQAQVQAPDFSPVAPGLVVPSPMVPEAMSREAWAERTLEKPFAPEPGILASFLINALYLVGNHRIRAEGGLDPEVTGVLTRIGHRVDAGGSVPPRSAAGGKHDRAVAAVRALGYGSDAETLDWLRNMRKTLAPGGLLAFHVFDRDRAWNLVGEGLPAGDDGHRTHAGMGIRARTAFDPATGRVSVRLTRLPGAAGSLPACGLESSVRAYNLLEVRGLLASAGFGLERAYGDWDGSGPEEGGARTGRLIVVASKRRVGRRGINRSGNRSRPGGPPFPGAASA